MSITNLIPSDSKSVPSEGRAASVLSFATGEKLDPDVVERRRQDRKLVEAILSGDEDSFARLHELYASRLYRFAVKRLGDATVAFFRGDAIISSHMPSVEGAAQGEEVSGGLAEALQDSRIREGHRTDPINLGGGSSRGVYSLITGGAAYSDVGYAIARPRSILSSPFDIFNEVADEDVSALPWHFIGGFAGIGFLFAMFFVWLERDRPMGKLRRASNALAEGKLERFDLGSHGGAYRKIAMTINTAIDRAVDAASASGPMRKAADLDEILGPSPDDAPSGNAFFGFAGGEDDGSIPPVPGGPVGQSSC